MGPRKRRKIISVIGVVAFSAFLGMGVAAVFGVMFGYTPPRSQTIELRQ